MKLDNQCVLITGGAQGIGKGLARACLQRGARVVITNRNETVAEATVAELSAFGAIRAIASDVTDAGANAQLLEDVWAVEGPPALLFSNAGAGAMKPLMESTRSDFDEQFSLNLYGALDIAQQFIRRVIPADKPAHVMFTGSENSLVMPPGNADLTMGTYGGTKHALVVMAEWLRHELRNTQVGISMLLPGPVLTESLAQTFEQLETIADDDPMRAIFTKEAEQTLRERFITPDECAHFALEGLEKGLFYIPTHAYIKDDVDARYEEISAAFRTLGLVPA